MAVLLEGGWPFAARAGEGCSPADSPRLQAPSMKDPPSRGPSGRPRRDVPGAQVVVALVDQVQAYGAPVPTANQHVRETTCLPGK